MCYNLSKVNDNTGEQMNNALSNIDIMREGTENKRKDFEKTLNIAAYHDVTVAEAVDLFYEIQVTNVDNLVREINILSHESGTRNDKILFGSATALNNKIRESVNEDIGNFNNMDASEKYKLLSTLAVTNISPATIEECREYILFDVMCKDGSYKPNIIESITDEKTAHFVKAIEGINSDFNKKNQHHLEELANIRETMKSTIVEYEPDAEFKNEPEAKPESKLKKLRNLFK